MALNFPDEPNDGDFFQGYVYNATRGVWDVKLPSDNDLEDLNNVSIDTPENGEALIYDGTEWTNQGLPEPVLTFSGLTDTNIATPTAGQKLVFDGTNWVNLNGYVYVSTVYFSTSGTFTKADYPWLRAIRVKCQGAGGGGGGVAATASGEWGGGAGGASGVYAESFVTNIAGLASSVTVTVGSGGSGGVGNVVGASGGSSSFGTVVSANGGGPGESVNPANFLRTAVPANGSSTGIGDLIISGRSGYPSIEIGDNLSQFNTYGGRGGDSFLGAGAASQRTSTTGFNGISGFLYGGGGGGAANNRSQAARTGGPGAAGIVIVELYA